MAMAIRMAMISTTTISSMSVKPRSSRSDRWLRRSNNRVVSPSMTGADEPGPPIALSTASIPLIVPTGYLA